MIVSTAANCQTPKALDIWRKAITIGADTPMIADMTLTERLRGKVNITKAHAVQGEHGKYRVEFSSPPEIKGRVVTSEGTIYWQFDQNTNVLTKALQIAGTGQGARNTDPLVERNYRFELIAGTVTLAGRPVFLLELLPKHPGLSLQRRWVDKTTYKILRIETRFADGIVSRDIVYDHIVLPAKVTEKDFQPKRNLGTRLVDTAQPADLLSQKDRSKRAVQVGLKADAPLGFQLLHISNPVIGGKPNTQLFYSDGIESISIFVQDGGSPLQDLQKGWGRIVLNGVQAFIQQVGHTNTIVWSVNGHRYTAVSRVAITPLRNFAGSLIPR